MISDRRRVELAAIPLIFLKCASRILGHCIETKLYEREQDHPELWPACNLLGEAAAEMLLDGRTLKDGQKLLRRAQRTAYQILADKGNGGVLPAYRYAQHLLAGLLEAEKLVLYAGSKFDRGYDLLETAILSEPDNAAALENLDRSAAKAARKALVRLEGEGVFA